MSEYTWLKDEDGIEYRFDHNGQKRNRKGHIVKGSKGVGGRKKGSKNVCPIKLRQSLLNKLKDTNEDGEEYGKYTNPLERMLQIISNDEEEAKTHIAATNVLMPYLMPKLTSADLNVKGAMEISGDQAAQRLKELVAKGLGGKPEDGDEVLDDLGLEEIEKELKDTL